MKGIVKHDWSQKNSVLQQTGVRYKLLFWLFTLSFHTPWNSSSPTRIQWPLAPWMSRTPRRGCSCSIQRSTGQPLTLRNRFLRRSVRWYCQLAGLSKCPQLQAQLCKLIFWIQCMISPRFLVLLSRPPSWHWPYRGSAEYYRCPRTSLVFPGFR